MISVFPCVETAVVVVAGRKAPVALSCDVVAVVFVFAVDATIVTFGMAAAVMCAHCCCVVVAIDDDDVENPLYYSMAQ